MEKTSELKLWSVAVQPTPEEVKKRGLHYDKPYYEDRRLRIVAHTAEEAVKLYNAPHHEIRFWLCDDEKPYVRATLVGSPPFACAYDTYLYEEALRKEAEGNA